MYIKTIVNQLYLYEDHMVVGNITNGSVQHNIKGLINQTTTR